MDIYSEAKDFLKALIKFDSVESTPLPDAPFGAGARDCLDFALATMKNNGFFTKNGGGYYGYGEIGQGELFGVLNHLDVVPVGDGWTHDPFGAEEADGKIFGRGALDDKGPFAAALFAAIKLLREGRTPKKRLRFILGCDEESGWLCMDRYVRDEELPALGISPDGDFPVINCEKGIVYHTIKCPLPDFLTDLNSGERANMVPNLATAVLTDGTTLTARGIAAHGSHPEKGVNALIKLLSDLAPRDKNLRAIYEAFSPYDGSGINLKISDDKSGALTLNLGCAKTVGQEIIFELDVRHPVTYEKDAVTAALKRALPELDIEQGFFHLPLYVPEDAPLITTLLSAYNEVMHTDAKPIAIGGGTYARVLPMGVAFGPCFPDGNDGMHCADEYMDIKDFEKMLDIYYLALKKICF